MLTVCLPMAWALRMRVNISAMGSVMLMGYSCCLASISSKNSNVGTGDGDIASCSLFPLLKSRSSFSASPGSLAQARHVAAHGRLAQFAAAETELHIDRARAAGHRAAGTQARSAGVARQLLQLGRRGHLVLVACVGAGDDLLEIGALAGVLLDQLRPLQVVVHHGFLG